MAKAQYDIYSNLKKTDAENNYYGKKLPFLEIKGIKYKARFTAFTGCEFESIVHFEDVELNCGLVFEDCQFKEPVVFENISVSQIDITVNPHSSISFINCTFEELVKISCKKDLQQRSVSFKGCTLKKGLEIDQLKVDNEGLRIRSCVINEKLDLFNISSEQGILLHSNTINTFCRIERVACDTIIIAGTNKFQDILTIGYSQTTNGIVFNNGVFSKEVKIELVTSKKTGLTIYGSIFEKAVVVNFNNTKTRNKSGLYAFYLGDSRFNNGFYVYGKQDLFAAEPSVELIDLNISAELKGDITFKDLQVGILKINGFNSSANLLFENLFINQIKIKGLINNAGLVFSGIRASYLEWFRDTELTLPRENALYIDDSNFGKAQFYQVDFSSFDTIVFHNNILTEISTSLVKWFTPEQLEGRFGNSTQQIYKEKLKSRNKLEISNARASQITTLRSRQEIYRQLKFSAQKQGNVPESLDFQRHEMNYYRRIVGLRKPRNWSEHLILWSNQSNDFGQNWLKALRLLLIFTFAFYLPVGFLTSEKLDYSRFASSGSDVLLNIRVVFWDNLKTWLVLLNPAHRLSEISEKITEFSSWVYFWDLLSRIVVSYFIFQLISAFRKLNK